MTRLNLSKDEPSPAEPSDSDRPPLRLREPGGFAQMLRRRRLIVIPAVILIVAGFAFAIVVEGPTYTVTARVVVLSPPNPPIGEGGAPTERTEAGKTDNPLARTDQAVVVAVVAGMTNREAERSRLEDAGADPDYRVEGFGGPVANITATSETAEGATNTVRIVSEAFIDNLAELQSQQGIDPDYSISTLPLEDPTAPVAKRSGLLRLAITITCAILIPVAAVVWVLESRLHARYRRNHPHTPNGSADIPSGTHDLQRHNPAGAVPGPHP